MPNRDVVLWNLIILGYVSCGGSKFLEEGRKLFDVMPERDCVSWNTMIGGYADGRMEDMLRLFNGMPQQDVVSWNAIVSGFLQNKDMAHAIDFFERMPERDCASLSALVSGLIRNGELDEAAIILIRLCGGALLGRACRMHNNVELARVAAEALMKLEPESSTPYVLLYNMYADVGRWDESIREVRMMMKSNKIKKPSVIVVSTEIGMLARIANSSNESGFYGLQLV
ncbi:hypothetical protein EZV62_011938 [Acer yangbiense]|uniref:Pentatricopeptide repeat-containing protein n=1 Tax=Acer yangbiense TaxID=1000413 RepID=A0A5C7I716_9ROSI|nr:hypothetical protein EZV62_011938 [Acer yangbiense]